MRYSSVVVASIGLALVAGCSDSGEPSPELLNQQRVAYRQACVTRELATEASENVATIEGIGGNVSPDDPIAALTRGATGAALEFARAYQRHAELREAAYAQIDSAANHSMTPGDSARYAERAERYTIRLPTAGTVEENVIVSYQNNLASRLGDGDHPCNWDLPF